nr:hypothetical protein [Tanacetum cinerariifolium]
MQYRSKDNVVRGTKKIKVEDLWKPNMCSQCKIFGHSDTRCRKNQNLNIGRNQVAANSREHAGEKNFTEVTHKRNNLVRNNDQAGFNQWKGEKRNVWNRNEVYKRKESSQADKDGDPNSTKESGDVTQGKNGQFKMLLNMLFNPSYEKNTINKSTVVDNHNENEENVYEGENVAAKKCYANQ